MLSVLCVFIFAYYLSESLLMHCNFGRQGTESLEWQDGSIQVFVRKRPLFKHELDNYEFDVVTACPGVSEQAAY
jgi:hypothetical protein